MNTNIFIPKKIKVGYQERQDTYTKKLAYVIYYDNKNILRKETSWEHWRNKKIEADDFINEPTSGFVLNKGVGGARQSWGWNTRNEYIRVYDPRNFEFEISVSNLLWILQETSSIKGKGLDGEFIYGWYGKELMLIPVNSQEYKECIEFTKIQDEKISTKDLTPGFVYQDSTLNEWIYLGRYMWYAHPSYYSDRYDRIPPEKINKEAKKQHIFVRNKDKEKITNYGIKHINSLATIKRKITDYPVENLAFLLDEFFKLKESCPFKEYGYRSVTIDELKELLKDNWRNFIFYKDDKPYKLQLNLVSQDNIEGDIRYVPENSNWYNGLFSYNREPIYNTISFEDAAKKFKIKIEIYDNKATVDYLY